jgi:hypothetical protein
VYVLVFHWRSDTLRVYRYFPYGIHWNLHAPVELVILGVPERYVGAMLLDHRAPLHRCREIDTLLVSIPAPVSVYDPVIEKFPIGMSDPDARDPLDIIGGVVSGVRSHTQEK